MFRKAKLGSLVMDSVAKVHEVNVTNPTEEQQAEHERVLGEYYEGIREFLGQMDSYVVLGMQKTAGTPEQLHPDENVQFTCLVSGEGGLLYFMVLGLLRQLEPWLRQELALALVEELALEEEMMAMKPQGEA